MFEEDEEVRMCLPLLVQSLAGRELDHHLSCVELARTAVDKVGETVLLEIYTPLVRYDTYLLVLPIYQRSMKFCPERNMPLPP